MKLDLDALAALDAVVTTGSYAQAAEHLHKVTSAVSYQVKKLEEQLRLPLLDRSGYRVRLTPQGEAVLAEGRRLLQHAHQVEALAQQLATGWEPQLTWRTILRFITLGATRADDPLLTCFTYRTWAAGASATCTAPPPTTAPPAAIADNFTRAIRTDISSAFFAF